jgi:four helix bundle protein
VASIRRVEDLECWRRARELTNRVYDVTDVGRFARDYPLRDQIRRSAESSMGNISEGFHRGSNPEFILFLSYSRGSAGETVSHLYVALDRKYITQETFDQIRAIAESVQQLDTAFINYLQRCAIRGSRYRRRPSATNNEKRETKNGRRTP